MDIIKRWGWKEWVSISTILAALLALLTYFGIQPSLNQAEPSAANGTPTTSTAPGSVLTTTSTEPAEPSPSPTPGGDDPGELVYLASLDVVDGGGVRFPTDRAISGKRYDQSIRVYCGPVGNEGDPAWAVAGYHQFTATIGIADDEKNAIDATAHISITDQDGDDLIRPFDTRLGQPKAVDLALDGVVQLRITCGGRDAATGERRGLFYMTLGNAAIRR